MKKIALLLVAMIVSLSAYSESVSDQMAKIEKLCEKLNKALEKAPKPCEVAEIDNYVDGCKTTAVGAVASAVQLQDFYKRQIGETVDGVTDVTVSKPSLEDWVSLGTTIATQAAGAAKVGESAAAAAKALKDVPKMKAISIGKSVKWSGDILPVASEALMEEGKAVKEIIETIKSGNNL